MPIRVDAYTNTGMANGWLLDAAHLREALERGQPLELTRVTWQAMAHCKSCERPMPPLIGRCIDQPSA